MKTIIAVVAVFFVGSALYLRSLAISDYHSEIATVRTLLAGKKVPYNEYRAFQLAECIGTGNIIGYYFHKKVNEQGLDLAKVDELCRKNISTLVFGDYPRD